MAALDCSCLLYTSRTLLETKKISQISVSEIAQTAGIGKGSIYYYFSSKEAIFDAQDVYKRQVQDGDYSVNRGAEKLGMSVDEFEKSMSEAGYRVPELVLSLIHI